MISITYNICNDSLHMHGSLHMYMSTFKQSIPCIYPCVYMHTNVQNTMHFNKSQMSACNVSLQPAQVNTLYEQIALV